MKSPPSSEHDGSAAATDRWRERRRRAVDAALERSLEELPGWPRGLVKAVGYSLLAGGKRLRPLLALGAAEACGGEWRAALPAACALEYVHTYSLIHDDLPAMDDDDFRRGRPTSHRVFGEALAILAGDALLTRAFELLAAARAPAEVRLAWVRELAGAGGGGGMIGGQVADVAAEGTRAGRRTVEYIHRHKTAALITAAARMGAQAAGAGPAALRRVTAYGQSLGLAFQIVDDLLDEEGRMDEMGKTPGSDRRRGKATYPAVWGVERSRREARRLEREAVGSLSGLGPGADPLRGLAHLVLERRS